MSDLLKFLLSLIIGLAVIIGVIRFRKIDRAYYPFVYRVCLVLIVEIIRRTLEHNRDMAVITLNVFSYCDFFLFTWLFHNWGLFGKNRKLFLAIVLVFLTAWLGITAIPPGKIFSANLYFRIIYAFALIFFSVTTLNTLIINDRGIILKNAKFWISIGIVIFYTLFILVCVTQLAVMKGNVSKDFIRHLGDINAVSNVFVNLLYAIAVVWIPRKKIFTTVYSL